VKFAMGGGGGGGGGDGREWELGPCRRGGAKTVEFSAD